MIDNKYFNSKTLGAGFLLVAAAGALQLEKTPAPTIAQCEADFNNAERTFRVHHGYNLTDTQRDDVLKLMGKRRACIEQAKEGQPSYSLAWRF